MVVGIAAGCGMAVLFHFSSAFHYSNPDVAVLSAVCGWNLFWVNTANGEVELLLSLKYVILWWASCCDGLFVGLRLSYLGLRWP